MRECFFQGDEGEEEEIGEEVEAEEEGGKVGGQEGVEKVCGWMVVRCTERERGGEAMVPGLVGAGEEGIGLVEGVAVEDVGKDFADEVAAR